MDSASQEDQDRIVSTGETPEGDSLGGQPLSPKDERIVAGNPPSDVSVIGPSRSAIERPHTMNVNEGLRIIPPVDAHSQHERTFSYGSYSNGTGTWDGYAQYPSAAEGMHMSPVIYNDNSSLVFPPGYGFNPDMAYGQYSPVATPMPSFMLDGQLYSPQQIPFSPALYPQQSPDFPSSFPFSSSEIMASESNSESMLFGPASGYYVHYGPYGGGNMSGAPDSNPLTSPAAYHQPMGILGPYEQHFGQVSQHRPVQGYGSTSTSPMGRYERGGSYQPSNFGGSSVPYAGARMRFGIDKGRRRDQETVYFANESLGFDRNRGPRASKLRSTSAGDQDYSGNRRDDSSGADVAHSLYNRPDFPTHYDNAKFFIIKSFSEDNVHKSVKYGVWASTPHGNKKLDAAYNQAKEIDPKCPIFLLFSVNASGQFCGVAEMLGPVDFGKDADYWQQDRWSGQFPVHWHIVKDVPNTRFRHILLENNENKPVTHSRDCQEVKLKHGIEILKIFKSHDSQTSILDDFEFYDQRERGFKERKSKQQDIPTMDSTGDETVTQISDTFAQTLKLDDDSKETKAEEEGGCVRTDTVEDVSNSNDKDIVPSKSSDGLNIEDDSQRVQVS
ncbi:YTH domain-containing protein ECT3 [Linum grandiflorum]